MQNFKGEKKSFARYLASEYNDLQFEPLEKELPSNIQSLLMEDNINMNPSSVKLKPFNKPVKEPKDCPPPQNFSFCWLTSSYIKSLTDRLGSDARNCFSGLFEFQEQKKPKNTEKLYDKIYNRFRTIPILFLSIIYQNKDTRQIRTVYLWQINKLYPYKEKMKFMSVDCQKDRKYGQSSSLLLLAKIVPEEGENIFEAKLLGDSRLFVKSATQDSKIIIRLYNIADFYLTARINPYKHDVIANNYFSFSVVLSIVKNKDYFAWEAQLWAREKIEDLYMKIYDKETKEWEETKDSQSPSLNHSQLFASKSCPISLQNNQDLSFHQAFSPILIEQFGAWQIFEDDLTCTFLVLGKASFEIFSFPEVGSIHSTRTLRNDLYILNMQGQIFRLDLSTLPNIIFSKISIPPFDSLENHFHWQVVKIWDSTLSLEVEHIIYSLENKLYAISVAESSTPNMILNLNIEGSSFEIVAWSIFGLRKKTPEKVIDAPVVVYVANGSLTFYNIETKERKSLSNLYFHESQIKRAWRIILSSKGTLFIYDHLYENLIISINYSTDLEVLFSEQSTPCVEYLTHFSRKNKDGSNYCRIQVRDDNKIILITGDGEPYYKDYVHEVYGDSSNLPIPVVEEVAKLGEKEKCANEERKKDEKQETLKEVQKIRKNMSQSVNKQSRTDENNKALKIVRDKIVFHMNDIKQYHIKFKEARNKHRFAPDYVPNIDPPEDVPREYLNVYQQVKEQKLKENKHKDKEKTRKKNKRRNSEN